jgi:hypothetical protein
MGALLKKRMPGVTRKAVLTMNMPELGGTPPADHPQALYTPTFI